MVSSPISEWYQESIGSVISTKAEESPENIFAIYGHTDERITYGELDRITNSFANSLLKDGLKPGSKVSVMSKNSLQTLIAMYGCSKAGLIYCPINYNYHSHQLAYQLNDTRPDLLLIDRAYISRIEDIDERIDFDLPYIQMDSEDPYDTNSTSLDRVGTYGTLLEGAEKRPDVRPSWDDTAWLIYTSGTTGDPKGVSLPHRWVLANHAGYVSLLYDNDEVIHSTLPFYHIGGASYEVTATLMSGATVVLWDKFSTDEYLDRVQQYDSTFSLLAGVMINWLADKYKEEEYIESSLRKIHLQPLVGEYNNFTDKFGVDFVSVAFGQTESGLSITGIIDTRDSSDESQNYQPMLDRLSRLNVPVVTEPPGERYMGKPRTNMIEVSVVNDCGRHLNAHEVGELVLRPQRPGVLFTEYLDAPTQTIEAFENLWFHTGDYVYYDEDDNYYFVDRDNSVIRRRGENISSKRVQDLTNRLDSVVQAAAFPVPAEEGGEDEVGIAVVLKTDETLDKADFQARLADEMPSYMVPSYIWEVTDIPETPTNKMKKEELKERLLEN